MKILALDTSSSACSIALLQDEKIVAEHIAAPMQQAKLILPMIEKLMLANELKLAQLDAIAFGCGPGSFTGVRIGVSVAQGLAFAAQVPMISVSSLAALAQGTYETLGWTKILAAIDARMNEIYYGAYQVNSAGLVELIGKEVVDHPANLVFPVEHDWYGAGNAWENYRQQLTCHPQKIDATREPVASAILTLAREKFLRQDWMRAGEAVPVYLRDDVAKKAK